MVVLGPLLLGPKRLHTILGHLARAKASFDVASRSFRSQITADLEAQNRERRTDATDESAGDQ
jgi:Sec-independent protein translocase protein TatA